MGEIDWDVASDLILRRQAPVRAYRCEDSGVLRILQEAGEGDEFDQVIEVQPENVRAFVDALLKLAGQANQ